MLAIIQARMSSQRLVGKALHRIAEKPLLGWVYDRLSRAEHIQKIVVSTSISESDEPIKQFCESNKIPVHRGSLEDVTGRLLDCAEGENADFFVRISGDSPFIDPLIVDHAIAIAIANPRDLITNVQFRSFPKGQSVEVIRTEALARAWRDMSNAEDYEHVTRYFYGHPDLFTISNFSCPEPMPTVQLSVDTVDDLRAAETIVQKAGHLVSWRSAAVLRSEIIP